MGINAHRLAKVLRRLKIRSRKFRISGDDGPSEPKNGYFRSDFEEAWQRYLSPEDDLGENNQNIGTTGRDPEKSGLSVVEQDMFRTAGGKGEQNSEGGSNVPLDRDGNGLTGELLL